MDNNGTVGTSADGCTDVNGCMDQGAHGSRRSWIEALATSAFLLVTSHPVTSAVVATAGIGAVVLVISVRTSKTAAGHYDRLHDEPRRKAPALRTPQSSAKRCSPQKINADGRVLAVGSGLRDARQEALKRIQVFRAARRESAMLRDLEAGPGAGHAAIKDPLPQFGTITVTHQSESRLNRHFIAFMAAARRRD